MRQFAQRTQVVGLAAKSRLPAIYYAAEYVEHGGLMSYGTNFADLYRRAAIYVCSLSKLSHAFGLLPNVMNHYVST